MIRFNGKTEMTNNIRAPVNIPMDCTKDHLIYSRSKFSDLCIVSNFNCLMQDLKEKEKYLPTPPLRFNLFGQSVNPDWVYTTKEHCEHHEWHEHLYIRRIDNPFEAYQDLLNFALNMMICLKEVYPIVDYEDYIRLQQQVLNQYWQDLPLLEKINLCLLLNENITAVKQTTPPPKIQEFLFNTGNFI